MGKGRDSLSDGVSMASRSMSRPVTSSSSSSGERERKAEGKSSETRDSLPPEDEQQLLPWQQEDAPAKHQNTPMVHADAAQRQEGAGLIHAGMDGCQTEAGYLETN